MRSVSVILIAVLLPAIVITICSFTVKDFDKNAFAIRCYEYLGNNKNLDNTAWDFVQQAQFLNLSNWVQGADNPETVCTTSTYICRLCFDDSQLNGNVTFQKILQSFYQYIVITPFYGPQIIVLTVGGTNVTVRIYTDLD